MPSQQPALNITISRVRITLRGDSFTHTFARPIEGYHGEPLFLYRFRDGNTVVLNVGTDEPANDTGLLQAVVDIGTELWNPQNYLTLTVRYNDTPTERWTIPLDYRDETLRLGMKLSPDQTEALLTIDGPYVSPQEPSGEADSILNFLVVEDDESAPGGGTMFRLHWIEPIVVDSYADMSALSLILPPAQGGSVTGPMGLVISADP